MVAIGRGGNRLSPGFVAEEEEEEEEEKEEEEEEEKKEEEKKKEEEERGSSPIVSRCIASNCQLFALSSTDTIDTSTTRKKTDVVSD